MKKIITVVGARPQFVKVGPISAALKEYPNLKEIILHTGQHFDDNMSDIFFRELNLPLPDVSLGISGGSHGEQTAAMLVGIEVALKRESPDLVLVYGDTNSTLAGAIAASKLNIPIAHVEAGLRSFNRKMPEEINRIVTDQLSTLLFTPSQTADDNLAREGIKNTAIFQVGDVMHDAVLKNIERAEDSSHSLLQKLALKTKDYFMLTLHRAENTDDDDRLSLLVDEILDIASTHHILFPIHPRTRLALTRIARLEQVEEHLDVVSPLGYLNTLSLLKNASLLLTDSGGMQKEAMFLRTPCITLRNETEWIETLTDGANCLYDNTAVPLRDLVSLQSKREHNFDAYPYGQGDTARKVCQKLGTFLKMT